MEPTAIDPRIGENAISFADYHEHLYLTFEGDWVLDKSGESTALLLTHEEAMQWAIDHGYYEIPYQWEDKTDPQQRTREEWEKSFPDSDSDEELEQLLRLAAEKYAPLVA
jgi:hypothetical protein